MRYRHYYSNNKKLISKKEAFDFLKEFKRFAFRGNFLELSVGVVIGGSFNKIISSLVDNVLMPMISILLPFESSYKSWSFTLYGKEVPFGAFLGDVVTFLVVSFFLFIFIKKMLVYLFREEEDGKEKELSLEEKTLIEIKEILEKLADNHS